MEGARLSARAGELELADRPRGSTPSSSYAVKIHYEFEAEGATRWGDRIQFPSRPFGDEGDAAAVVAEYPAGRAVTISYQPGNPGLNVLEPGPKPGAWRTLLVGPYLIAIGLVIALVLPRVAARRST